MILTFNVKVSIEFESFSTEHGFDYLEVRDGDSSDSDLIAKVSGQDLPSQMESTGRSMTMVFNSDGINTYPGFKIIANEGNN